MQNVDASVHTPSEAGSLRASGRSWSRLCASVHTPSEAGSLRASGRLSAGTGMGTQTEKARRKQRVTAVSAMVGPSGGGGVRAVVLSCCALPDSWSVGAAGPAQPSSSGSAERIHRRPIGGLRGGAPWNRRRIRRHGLPHPPRLCPSPCVPCARVCPLQGSALPPASPAWQCSLSTTVRRHTEELRTLGPGAVAVLLRVAGPSGGEVSDPLHPSQPTVCPALPR